MEDIYEYFRRKLANAQSDIEMVQKAVAASAELRPTPNFVEMDIKAQECLERIKRIQELLDIIYANKRSATESLYRKDTALLAHQISKGVTDNENIQGDA